MIRTAAIAATLALAGAAQAQTNSFSLVDGNFRYNERALDNTGTSTGTADFGLDTGSATAVGSDYLYQNWWWMGVDGGAHDALRIGEQTSLTQLAPNSAVLQYQRAGVTVALTYTLNQISPDQAAVTINWNVTNTNQNAVEVDFINYTDFDVLGAGGDLYAHSTPTGFEQVRADDTTGGVPNGAFATLTADLRAPSAWQVGPYSGTGSPRIELTDGDAEGLNNAINGTNPADLAAAFQWALSLDAGESLGGRITKGYNYDPVPAPGAFALLGLGGLVATRRRRA